MAREDHPGHDEELLRTRLTAHMIPQHLHEGLLRYFLHGIRPGGYLCAVLSNNLRETIDRAATAFGATHQDAVNIIRFCEMNAPGTAWGSPAAIDHWCLPTEYRPPMPYDGCPADHE